MRKPTQIAIIVSCFSASGFLLFNFITAPSPTANEGIMDAYHFKCVSGECRHEFTWLRGEDVSDRGSIDTCPECLTPNASPCAKGPCGHFQVLQGHGTYDLVCPGCGEDMPPLREQR